MKKRNTLIVILMLLVFWLIFNREKAYDEEFSLPEGFTGCGYVLYNIEGAPPLIPEYDTIVHEFNNEENSRV